MPTRPTPPEARLAAVAASRALLTVGAVAAALAALAASAPVRRPAQHRTPAPDADVDRALRAHGAGGPGRPVWTWNPRFVEGDPGAEPLLRAFTWVAARDDGQGQPGTATVRQAADESGVVTLAGTDDDTELARALGTLAPDEVLVADDGDWLAVAGDVVRPLLAAPRSELTGPVSVAVHRASLRARRDAGGRVGARAGTAAGGGSGSGSGSDRISGSGSAADRSSASGSGSGDSSGPALGSGSAADWRSGPGPGSGSGDTLGR